MSQNEHDMGHKSPNRSPKKLITIVVFAILVPILVIALLSQFVANIRGADMKSPAMSPDAVAKRLKPVGELALADAGGGAATAPEKAAAAAPAQDKAWAGKADGKKIYETACAVCHAAGVGGAPKPGDKAAWAPRLKTGMNALYANALKGKGAMPPKGGNSALADAEVNAAVDYLASLAK